MKTPERWRALPRRALLVTIANKNYCSICVIQPITNFENYIFQYGDPDLWPMTLTFEPIWDIIKVNPHAKL